VSTTVPPEVAELLSGRSLAVRDLDLGLVITGIDAVEFLGAHGVDLDDLVRGSTGQHACERALRLLVRVRRHVLLGVTTWAVVREHLYDQLEREELS
jgi:hypothetical protein